MDFITKRLESVYSTHVEKNNISDIDWFRLKLIFTVNCIFIITLIPSILIKKDTLALTVHAAVISCFLILIVSNLSIYRGYIILPVTVTVLYVPSICFAVAFSNLVPFAPIFAQLCLLLVYHIWLISSHYLRITYSIIYYGLLFLLYSQYFNLKETASNMLIIFCYVVLFHVVSYFNEKQDVAISNSLKKQKELNNSLVNKNNDLKTFSHIMSHDLKTPLNHIISFAQFIKGEVSFENRNHQQYFEMIQGSAHKMNKLIDDLLLYHNVELDIDNFEKINLNDIIDQICESYQGEIENQEVIIKSKPLPEVNGDPILLNALLSNLFSNSIKYQPKKEEEHIPKIELWSSSKLVDDFEIYFSDNGIGINEKYINDLFTPFKRYHIPQDYDGTGLGMSICDCVMKKHLGSIKLYKTSEKGTTFVLKFPRQLTTVNDSDELLPY